jgi:PadR family transcriptional regulator
VSTRHLPVRPNLDQLKHQARDSCGSSSERIPRQFYVRLTTERIAAKLPFAWTTWMASESKDRVELLQGTLDLIVLRALHTMGAQHAYGLAARLEQVAAPSLRLNQGTLYPALVRLEQKGWIKGTWQRTESNREAKYYAITKAGVRGLEKQTERWRRLAGLVDKLLLNEG